MKKFIIMFLLIVPSFYVKGQERIEEGHQDSFVKNYNEGIESFSNGNIKKAEIYFLNALEKKPDDINTLRYLAQVAIANQNLSDIKYYYNKVLNLDSNDESALISLGVIYLNNGNMKKAEDLLVKAVNNQSDNEQALFNLGVLYGTKGEFSKAISTLNKLIKIDPNKGEYYETLGLFYLSHTIYPDAELNFLKAIKLDQNLTEARKGLIIIYQNQLKLNESLKFINELDSISPDVQYLNILKATQYYLQGKVDKAIQYALIELKNFRDEPDVYYLLSDLYSETGNETKSKQYLHEAERRNRNNSIETIYSLLNIK